MSPDLFAWTTLYHLVPCLILAVLFWILPTRTHPELYFAVTVDAAYRETEAGRQTLARYRRGVAAATAVALALVAAGYLARNLVLGSIAIMVLALGVMVAFVAARRRTLPSAAVPSTRREAGLAPRPAAEMGTGLAMLAPFALLTAMATWLLARWDTLPERFPVHWGATGQPDGWGTRTPGMVLGPLAFGALLTGLILLLAMAVLRGVRRTAAEGGRSARERAVRRLVSRTCLGAAWLTASTFSLMAAIPLLQPVLGPDGLLVAILSVGLGGTAVLLVVVAIGMTRLPARLPADGPPRGDLTPDRCWKGGLFYVNPDDPAVWVEKRFGIGYTLNLGQPAGRWTLAALLVSPLVLAILALLLLN